MAEHLKDYLNNYGRREKQINELKDLIENLNNKIQSSNDYIKQLNDEIEKINSLKKKAEEKLDNISTNQKKQNEIKDKYINDLNNLLNDGEQYQKNIIESKILEEIDIEEFNKILDIYVSSEKKEYFHNIFDIHIKNHVKNIHIDNEQQLPISTDNIDKRQQRRYSKNNKKKSKKRSLKKLKKKSHRK